MILQTLSPKIISLLALALLVPAPTIGVLMAMHFDPGPVGQAVYGASKVWILLLPLAWLRLVDGKRPDVSSPLRAGGIGLGAVFGVIIGGVILGGYLLVGKEWIDADAIRAVADRNGLDEKWKYLALAGYLCVVNSLLEEYVWRWFVFRHGAALMPRWPAVILSSVLFTVHHILALGLQFDWRLTILGSAGVCIGGITWSWLYLRFGTVWPGWVSHMIVDVAVFIVGWHIIFVS